MAHSTILVLTIIPSIISALTTCPGFPGYCSESFPGHSCNVVCSFGRNNVPLCQSDGTWTDIPRCVEHDPGVEDQIPGLCPSIPGYCSQNFLNGLCKFDCPRGADISSVCTPDGTWAPYPTCEGDLRETRDGCDGCPGAVGGRRNRTAEAILGINRGSNRRVPKIIRNDGGRKTVPSFAGNINIGPIKSKEENTAFTNKPTPRSGPRLTEQPLTFFPNKRKTLAATQTFRPEPQKTIKNQQAKQFQQILPPQTFGVFEAVDLGASFGGSSNRGQILSTQREQRPARQNENFFGVFQSVNLQG